jgi:hypothetical protein
MFPFTYKDAMHCREDGKFDKRERCCRNVLHVRVRCDHWLRFNNVCSFFFFFHLERDKSRTSDETKSRRENAVARTGIVFGRLFCATMKRNGLG